MNDTMKELIERFNDMQKLSASMGLEGRMMAAWESKRGAVATNTFVLLWSGSLADTVEPVSIPDVSGAFMCVYYRTLALDAVRDFDASRYRDEGIDLRISATTRDVVPPVVETPERIIECGDCDGTGYQECECCGQDIECKSCNGLGKFVWRAVVSRQFEQFPVEDVLIDERSMIPIRDAGALVFLPKDPTKGQPAAHFVVGDVKGLVQIRRALKEEEAANV